MGNGWGSMGKTKYYVTTQICDAVAPLSIESTYRAVLGDAIARHKRMCGFDVAYLMGTNTRGQRTELGENRGPNPALATSNDEIYTDALKHLDVHTTHFISTGSNEHTHAVHTLLRRTMRRSRLAIYKGKYEGRYGTYDRIDVSGAAQPNHCPKCGRATTLISEGRYFFASQRIEIVCWPFTETDRTSSSRRLASTRSSSWC